MVTSASFPRMPGNGYMNASAPGGNGEPEISLETLGDQIDRYAPQEARIVDVGLS